MNELENDCQKALELGLQGAKEIDPRSIVTAEWVRMKCQYGCPGYGKNLSVRNAIQTDLVDTDLRRGPRWKPVASMFLRPQGIMDFRSMWFKALRMRETAME